MKKKQIKSKKTFQKQTNEFCIGRTVYFKEPFEGYTHGTLVNDTNADTLIVKLPGAPGPWNVVSLKKSDLLTSKLGQKKSQNIAKIIELTKTIKADCLKLKKLADDNNILTYTDCIELHAYPELDDMLAVTDRDEDDTRWSNYGWP